MQTINEGYIKITMKNKIRNTLGNGKRICIRKKPANLCILREKIFVSQPICGRLKSFKDTLKKMSKKVTVHLVIEPGKIAVGNN